MKRSFFLSVWLPLCTFLLLSATDCSRHNPNETPAWDPPAGMVMHDFGKHKLKLPEGFKIGLYANKVPNARAMALGSKGTLFVGSRGKGKVHALVDRDGDMKADTMYLIASGLRMPTGLAFKDGSLYVAAVSRIYRWDDIETKLSNPGDPVLVSDAFPSDGHHGWKYLAFGPEGKLYVPVGAPCNICERLDNPMFASITRMNPDGSDIEVFASGIRNSAGFDFDPKDGALWMTDNGRDWLGDDSPGDELNRADAPGMHFGYPYCHQGDTPDPELGEGKSCEDYTAPAQVLGPHVAALGMKFYTGEMFPEAYRSKIFIAEHGSWNREKPLGYRVTMVDVIDGKASNYQVFAEGWLERGDKWGRPSDILILPDGSMLVSDDHGDRIWRISYPG